MTTFKTVTLTPKRLQKMQLSAAYHDGFRAACEAMRKVYSPAAEYKVIREVINAVDHVQGDPSMVRHFRRKLKAKGTVK